eukprot:COSAG01_NODE_10186_length_2227_cov_1.814380_1_plen_95_part_10
MRFTDLTLLVSEAARCVVPVTATACSVSIFYVTNECSQLGRLCTSVGTMWGRAVVFVLPLAGPADRTAALCYIPTHNQQTTFRCGTVPNCTKGQS